MNTYVHLLSFLAHFFVEWEMFQTKVVEKIKTYILLYSGADKSLARPTSRCILFDGENISFDVKSCYIQNVPGGMCQTSGGCSLC